MIRRLYVHNFRCLQNFELKLAGQSSVLLVGKNGTGKTTIAAALAILQQIGRGAMRACDVVQPRDLALGHSGEVMRIEIEAEIDQVEFTYGIGFELPSGASEFVVRDETLTAGGELLLDRSNLPFEPHVIALQVVARRDSPAEKVQRWLSRLVILRPLPSRIGGESEGETLLPDPDVHNLGAWWGGVLANAPSGYGQIAAYLKQVIPDLKEIRNPLVGRTARNMEVLFGRNGSNWVVDFRDLSDGEKCLVICAVLLAANETHGPLVCFWDEPDNYLAISEVSHLARVLRSAFFQSGQFICTSHNAEVMRAFTDETTFLLYRKSHLDPVLLRPLSEVKVNGDLAEAMAREALDPWA